MAKRIRSWPIAGVLACVLALSVPTTSSAATADPSLPAVDPGSIAADGTTPAVTQQAPAAESDSGFPPVPLTGRDALVLSAVALSLVAAGFALRRLSTRA